MRRGEKRGKKERKGGEAREDEEKDGGGREGAELENETKDKVRLWGGGGVNQRGQTQRLLPWLTSYEHGVDDNKSTTTTTTTTTITKVQYPGHTNTGWL